MYNIIVKGNGQKPGGFKEGIPVVAKPPDQTIREVVKLSNGYEL